MIKFLYLFMILFAGNAYSQLPINDEMINTTEKIIHSIKNNNLEDFENIIGVSLDAIGKDKPQVAAEFKECNYYYNLYNTNYKLKILMNDSINILGQKKVSVIFFDGSDSVENIKKIGIDLFYGPPALFSLKKISGYNIIFVRNQDFNLIAPIPAH